MFSSVERPSGGLRLLVGKHLGAPQQHHLRLALAIDGASRARAATRCVDACVMNLYLDFGNVLLLIKTRVPCGRLDILISFSRALYVKQCPVCDSLVMFDR